MSFVDLKPYFRDRLKAVSPDLKEWKDAFNIENIPSTILNKSYHIDLGLMTYRGSAQTCFQYLAPVSIRVIFKGYREAYEAVDFATKYADSITTEVCATSNRLNQARIKNVLPTTVNIRQLADGNDNAAVLELGFDCALFLNVT